MSRQQQIDELAITLLAGGLSSEEAWHHAQYEIDHAEPVDAEPVEQIGDGISVAVLYVTAFIVGTGFTLIVMALR